MKIDVLNNGFVRLVSFMQPAPTSVDEAVNFDGNVVGETTFRNRWTGDLEVVRNARVSYNADWRTGEDENNDERLIRYLMKNHHTSPFEAMAFTFEVKVPFFIARQWHRHRTWAYNEVSARYAQLDLGWFIPEPDEVGIQSRDNKQMRILIGLTEEAISLGTDFIEELSDHSALSDALYRKALASGIPRELARAYLQTNFFTRYFGTVNLHNLFHFIRLRVHAHAQPEIQRYAKALMRLIEPIVPVSCEAFQELLTEELQQREALALIRRLASGIVTPGDIASVAQSVLDRKVTF